MADDYTVGEFYPVTREDIINLVNAAGFGAGFIIMGAAQPALIKGRRYTGPGQWEFWMDDGRKVTASVAMTGNVYADHVILARAKDPDPEYPALVDRFPEIAEAEKLLQAMAERKAAAPRKCIKPGCENMVMPIGLKPVGGAFKNYRGTGACQKGHNSFYCLKCKAPHSFASVTGKDHFKRHYGKDWDGTDMDGNPVKSKMGA